METAIFFFHPHFEASRVNAALIEAARGLDNTHIRNMYDLYPHGDIDVNREHAALSRVSRIVLQFPMYWYSVPPLAKMWMDDVLTYGWAYGTGGTALRGKELCVAVTTGSPARAYSHEGEKHYSVHELLRPLQATSALIGTKFMTPFVVNGAANIDDDALRTAASSYAHYLSSQQSELGWWD